MTFWTIRSKTFLPGGLPLALTLSTWIVYLGYSKVQAFEATWPTVREVPAAEVSQLCWTLWVQIMNTCSRCTQRRLCERRFWSQIELTVSCARLFCLIWSELEQMLCELGASYPFLILQACSSRLTATYLKVVVLSTSESLCSTWCCWVHGR